MSASKVYFTDMRCPVGTGLLDKLKKLNGQQVRGHQDPFR